MKNQTTAKLIHRALPSETHAMRQERLFRKMQTVAHRWGCRIRLVTKP